MKSPIRQFINEFDLSYALPKLDLRLGTAFTLTKHCEPDPLWRIWTKNIQEKGVRLYLMGMQAENKISFARAVL